MKDSCSQGTKGKGEMVLMRKIDTLLCSISLHRSYLVIAFVKVCFPPIRGICHVLSIRYRVNTWKSVFFKLFLTITYSPFQNDTNQKVAKLFPWKLFLHSSCHVLMITFSVQSSHCYRRVGRAGGWWIFVAPPKGENGTCVSIPY